MKMSVVAAALAALITVTATARPIRVAYPVPGADTLRPPKAVLRIVLGYFLDDLMKHDRVNFAPVKDQVKHAVLAQVNSGAWAFETDDKRLNFSKWKPVDLFIDFNYVGDPEERRDRVGGVKVDFWYEGANNSKEFPVERLVDAGEWILEQILAKCGLPEADVKRHRAFFAARRGFFYEYYIAQGVVGHYTDSGVDPRMDNAQAAYKRSKFDPLVATRVVDAAYLDVLDTREKHKYTSIKVKEMGLVAFEYALGKLDPLDEEIMRPFAFHYAKDIEKILARVDKELNAGSLDDLEEMALSGEASGNDEDEEMSNVKKRSPEEIVKTKAAVKRFRDWLKDGYEKAPPDPDVAAEVERCVTGGGDHPLLVRHRLTAAFARKDVAFLESHLCDYFRQNRAYALDCLAKLSPETAYPHLMKAMEDTHTWSRLYASIALAKLAKSADAQTLKAFRAKERNRAVKLYLDDAIAKAEGRPLPAPQPAAHSIPKDRMPMWGGMGGGSAGLFASESPWEASYTCAPPALHPNDEYKRAYEKGKFVLPRPTPVGDGGLVVSDPATADLFWTRLEEQCPDECLKYTDGFVYGEESMGMDPWANWTSAWRVFCIEAGIDPESVRGDRKNLTPEQRLRYLDWGKAVCVEGFNLMYDFTKDYFGKLKPGFWVCTAACHESGVGGVHALDWKFDISMGYIYGVGPTKAPRWRNRRAYALVRQYLTLWPDRPCQWGSWGMPRHLEVERQMETEAAAEKAKGRQPKLFPHYRQIWEQEPMFPRFDECYSATITSYQAGGMPGWFTAFSIEGKTGSGGCVWLDNEGNYEGQPSLSLEAGIKYAFADTLVDYRDAMKKKAAPDLDDAEASDLDDLELEEEGGEKDPAFIKQQEDIKKFRKGYFNAYRYVFDTVRTQVGLPHYNPQDFNTLLVAAGRGRHQESAAAQWMNGFDYVDNAAHPVQRDILKKYRFIGVSDTTGKGTEMDEATKLAWLKWIRETPGVLWVEGYLADNPRRSFAKPEGDLVSKWPWSSSVTNSAETLVVWTDPAYKAMVIFEKPSRKLEKSTVEEGGRIVKDFFDKRGVKMDWPVAPGVITTKVGNLEIQALSQWTSYEGKVEGVELLTGEVDPVVTPKGENGFAMVAKGDYLAPWVTVQNGIRVLAGNRFDKVVKVPGGVKVTLKDGPFGPPSALPRKDVRMRQEGGAYIFTR